VPQDRPRIAVFAGPGATVLNTMPLVTGQRARAEHDLPPLRDRYGHPLRYEALRPQRLAAPVTVLIEQFSAHPLEADAADLYGPPDGYVDAAGNFSTTQESPSDRAVFRVTLRPDDGLYLLPYMARQTDGRQWDDDQAEPGAPPDRSRQPFYPDAERLFEEIDRFGVGDDGLGNLLSRQADFDHFRILPSGGYRREAAAQSNEEAGRDFFAYRPHEHRTEPLLEHLATVTNEVQRILDGSTYSGAIWLEGSPYIEETLYWLSLLIDSRIPIVGVASHRPHGAVSNDGDRNVIDAVDYICSGIWADAAGADRVGPVLVESERILAAREVQKSDARPGGHIVTGGHGGVVGSMGQPGPPVLTFVPNRRRTWTSEVRTSELPPKVPGGVDKGHVRTHGADGSLLAEAIPQVEIVKHARYAPDRASSSAVHLVIGLVEQLRASARLGGLVLEGAAPYGRASEALEQALRMAALQACPIVAVGRGNAEGFVPPGRLDLAIAGSNLTATKARLLLMACLLRFGAPPPASNPNSPTQSELTAIRERLAAYQNIFDEH
jgi:L-asparaginase